MLYNRLADVLDAQNTDVYETKEVIVECEFCEQIYNSKIFAMRGMAESVLPIRKNDNGCK